MTNILLLYNSFIPSVRLCAYEQLCYLSETSKVRFEHCKIREITKDLIRNSDVIILVRSDSYLEEAVAKMLKKMGKYLVYVLDDDLLNVPPGLSSSKYYNSGEVKKRIREIMSLCDCLLSPSKKILEKYGSNFKKAGLIEEPALCYNVPPEKDRQRIKIGFAGSTDRSRDIDYLLSDVIKEIRKKYEEKVEIEFFGAKPDLIESLGLTYYPYKNSYEDYQKKMWELNWNIGLAPMPDTDFHHYKHYNKYVEYCANDIIGVYSNVYPYTEVIKDGENGFLCDNTKDAWIEKISYCIENYDRLDLVRKYIKNDAEGEFSIEHTAELFAKAIPEILFYRARVYRINVNYLVLYRIKMMSIIIKIWNFVKRNGIMTPIVFYRKLWKVIYKSLCGN